MSFTAPTATRTWDNGTATITVTFAGWPAQTVSGARAARAAAVLVADQGAKAPKVSCRASAADAEREAARQTAGGTSRTRFGKVPMPPVPTTVVLVTEA
ncbi:MAG TPA: hypothetical protein VK507_19170 [Iamia sp.]|nr:hypothetical protein [Iamia sp.]